MILLILLILVASSRVDGFMLNNYNNNKKCNQKGTTKVLFRSRPGTPSSRHRIPRAVFSKGQSENEKDNNSGVHLLPSSSRIPTIKPQYQPQQFLGGVLLSCMLAVTVLANPLPAYAGFGPSGGATTTEPSNLQSIETTALKVKQKTTPGATTLPSSSETTPSSPFDLDGKKLKQLIGSSLNDQRLEEFSVQVDTILDTLKDSVASFGDAISTGTDDSKGAKQLQKPGEYFELTPDQVQQLEAQELDKVDREERLQRLLDKIVKVETLQQQIKQQEQNLQLLQTQPYWFNYLAAFIGSAISTLIMHPLDTIKTRLQVASSSSSSTASGSPVDSTTTDKNTTTILTMKDATEDTDTTAEEDPKLYENLYEGLTGNLFKEGPPSAVYLGVYETVKYALSPKVPAAYLLFVYLIAGAAGETVGSVIRAPAEAVKSLVQSKTTPTVTNAGEAITTILATPEARTNIVRAWSASVGRDVPFGAIQLAVFELIKTYILNNPNIDIDSSTLLCEAIIGAFAGGLGYVQYHAIKYKRAASNPSGQITHAWTVLQYNWWHADFPEGDVSWRCRVFLILVCFRFS